MIAGPAVHRVAAHGPAVPLFREARSGRGLPKGVGEKKIRGGKHLVHDAERAGRTAAGSLLDTYGRTGGVLRGRVFYPGPEFTLGARLFGGKRGAQSARECFCYRYGFRPMCFDAIGRNVRFPIYGFLMGRKE